MNIEAKKADLQQRLSNLQGQKGNLTIALEQTTVAIERTIGQLQLLEELTEKKEPAWQPDGASPAPPTPISGSHNAGAATRATSAP
jgi:hypothetical protein